MFDEKTITELPEIKIEQVDCVYIGKPNLCRCGCAGKYVYTKANLKWSSANRGYTVTADEVSDKKVQSVINKMRKNQTMGIQVLENYIFSLQIGKTEYSIYLKTKKEK